MVVNPDVDGYAKARNHRKNSEKRKKQQPTENQKNTKHRNISQVCARF